MFQLGDRIKIAEYRGTIKYIGPVAPCADTWLGVEWDDSSRGKHSGSKNDVQYFV